MRILKAFFNPSDASVAWSACACLDYILTHIYKVTSPLSPAQGNNTNNASNVTNNDNTTNDNVMLNSQESEYPLFVPTPPISLPTSEIAQAARQRLTARMTGAVPTRGCCSALAIWSDREVAANANLQQNFIRRTGTAFGGVSEFTLASRQLIVTFLSSFMNEECKNQWSISRPLLALILLNQDVRHCHMFF